MEKELGYCCLVCTGVSAFTLIFLYWTLFHAMTESSVCAVYLWSHSCVLICRNTVSPIATIKNFHSFSPLLQSSLQVEIFIYTLGSLWNFFFLPLHNLRYNKNLVFFLQTPKKWIHVVYVFMCFYSTFWLAQKNIQVNKNALKFSVWW